MKLIGIKGIFEKQRAVRVQAKNDRIADGIDMLHPFAIEMEYAVVLYK